MYAVVAPGFSCVYSDWHSVARIKALYPYPKWIKCETQEQAMEFIRRNKSSKRLTKIYNYGDTFSDLYVTVHYKIFSDCICYVVNISKVGSVRIPEDPNTLIEYKGDKIFIKALNIKVSNESLAGHMSAIYGILKMLGPYLDVNLIIDYYSIFYCLTAYSKGKNRSVSIVRDLIDSRLCKVAFTLQLEEGTYEHV